MIDESITTGATMSNGLYVTTILDEKEVTRSIRRKRTRGRISRQEENFVDCETYKKRCNVNFYVLLICSCLCWRWLGVFNVWTTLCSVERTGAIGTTYAPDVITQFHCGMLISYVVFML